MGWFTNTNRVMTAAPLSLPTGILSDPVPLIQAIFPDVDTSNYPVSVGEAMAVPGVARVIALYSSLAARFPLVASDGSNAWMERSTGPITSQLRKAWTVQDIIWHNESLWEVVERDEAGDIADAAHISRDRWDYDEDGLVIVDGGRRNQDDLVYFRGYLPAGGFLANGRHSVRQYTSMAQTINSRANVPEPVTLVKETSDTGATPEEINAAMDQLEAALKSKRGGMVYVPYGVDIGGYGGSDNANQMMVAARNAIRLDLANHLGIKASLLEAVMDGSSDTYTNTLMVNNELIELSLKTFTEPISTRLSSDDITAEGVTVRFDYSSFDTAETQDKSALGTVPNSEETA